MFLLGSLWAGFARNVPELLAARALQGLGVGGLTALTQAVMGMIIAPCERGRYSGYLASAMAVATVSGRLITKTGAWKRYLLGGAVLLIAGMVLLGTIGHRTPTWLLGVFMA